jgi:hypothetical protein
MNDKNQKIQRNGITLSILSMIFAILNIVPSFAGASVESIAFFIATAIFPFGFGVAGIIVFSKAQDDLYKLHKLVMHISYIDVSMAITIVLLAFTPRVFLNPAIAILNVVAALGLGITGIWSILHTYSVTRYSIIP